MTAPATSHGLLALAPRAAQLVAARTVFNDPTADDVRRAEAARIMARDGNAFDQGRARAWLREQGVRP